MSNLDMSEALRMLAADRGITIDALLQVLVEALATAYKKRPGAAEEVIVGVNPDNMDITFTAYDVNDDGEWINERDDTPKKDELGRIAAVTFRQVMSQRIREVERERKFEEYANREGDIVSGTVQKTDTRYTLLDLGRVEALLPQAEQVLGETREPNARLKAYIVEVRRTPKGPQIVVSRTHPGLIMRLFEMEVPEIADRIVEIKSCAREPGQRTKIAVWSNDKAIDPVGACVGARGGRVRLSADETQADVIVPDFQLSLAIGKMGVNATLAARLTGVRLDIKSESEAAADGNAVVRRSVETVPESVYAEGEWKTNTDSGAMEWHAADGSILSQEQVAAQSGASTEESKG